jgi:hypothetical protein
MRGFHVETSCDYSCMGFMLTHRATIHARGSNMLTHRATIYVRSIGVTMRGVHDRVSQEIKAQLNLSKMPIIEEVQDHQF